MSDILKGAMLLKKYREASEELKNRIISNEKWYCMRHTDGMSEGRYTPASAWLFNSLAVKHADAMDAIPMPYVSAREPSDVPAAEALSKVLPVILEQNDFPEVYSAVWNDKLKHGTGCYGVFWDPSLHNGMGDIRIRRIDVLNLFWEPGVGDINDSPSLFHVELRPKDEILAKYPQIKSIPDGTADSFNRFVYSTSLDMSDKAAVVDWYYKVPVSPDKTVIHYCKFVGNQKLFCTEDIEEFADCGLYDHGRYPFVTDVMYPIEGTPCGFGSIDIMKDAQMQIDCLNSAILENARMAASRRYFIRADGSVNEKEFADWSRPFVHIQGAGLGEDSIREIEVEPLSDIYLDVIDNKIKELKETSGNRDVYSGGTESGVTAASAITALQESAGKMTKDMISGSYRSFSKVCNLAVELIRQFYTATRCFRIIGGFMDYDNTDLSALVGNENGDYRLPVFDISVAAERGTDSKRRERNDMARELYEMGVFAPENREAARVLLSVMEFEGREVIYSSLFES